jgi:putative N6-adenine-specific DNA methylase
MPALISWEVPLSQLTLALYQGIVIIVLPMPAQTYLFKFFLIINPGLEELALHELKQCLPNVQIIKKDKGGIEFEAELLAGLRLNHSLKIPSRILLRLEDFAASDFPKLFKKMQRLPWEKFILPGTLLKIEVSSESSRLSIKKRIAETAEDAIRKYFKGLNLPAPQKAPPVKADAVTIAKARNRLLDKFAQNSKKKVAIPKQVIQEKEPESQKIFLRFIDDICHLSIDTSGEHLHKRGYRTLVGEAPLRENLASALLLSLFEKTADLKEVELIDPMLGSGTFLLEAYNSFLQTNMRNYSYEKWPLTKEKSQMANAPILFHPFRSIRKLSGYDQDQEAIRITQENFKNLKSGAASAEVGPNNHPPEIQLAQKNIFEKYFDIDSDGDQVLKKQESDFAKIIITNPPYGKRLKVEAKLSDFYTKVFADCESFFQPQYAGFLISDDVSLKQIKIPKNWQLSQRLEFRNGGIKVQFVIFKSN